MYTADTQAKPSFVHNVPTQIIVFSGGELPPNI